MEGFINRNAYTLLAISETECAAELHLVAEIVLSYQALQLLYYLTGAFNVTGASNTDCHFQVLVLAFINYFLRLSVN